MSSIYRLGAAVGIVCAGAAALCLADGDTSRVHIRARQPVVRTAQAPEISAAASAPAPVLFADPPSPVLSAPSQDALAPPVVDHVDAAPECCHGRPCAPSRCEMYWHGNLKPRLQHSHWGYPEYFFAPPLGASLYGAFQTQVNNGVAAQMILYRYDFCDCASLDGAQLNAYGRRRLHRLARLATVSPTPLMIERSHVSHEVDEARRAAVYAELAAVLPTPIPLERIVLVDPKHPGLDGDEASLIHYNMLEQTKRAATAPPGGSGAGGTTSGGAAPGGAAPGGTAPGGAAPSGF